MPTISVILNEFSVVATILFGILAAIYYRLSSLETRREREEYLRSKFDDRQWAKQPLVAEFDTLHVNEDGGLLYKFKRYIFGRFDGSTTVSLNLNFGFSEKMWEHDELMKLYHEITKADVDLRKVERLNSDTCQLILEIESVEHEIISHDVLAFLVFVNKSDSYLNGFELSREKLD